MFSWWLARLVWNHHNAGALMQVILVSVLWRKQCFRLTSLFTNTCCDVKKWKCESVRNSYLIHTWGNSVFFWQWNISVVTSVTTDGPRVSPLGDHMTRKDDTGDQPAVERRPRQILERHDMAEKSTRQGNLETACWGLRPTTGHNCCLMMTMMMVTSASISVSTVVYYRFKRLIVDIADMSSQGPGFAYRLIWESWPCHRLPSSRFVSWSACRDYLPRLEPIPFLSQACECLVVSLHSIVNAESQNISSVSKR